MDAMEKIAKLKDKEYETITLSNHLEFIKNNMEKMTKEEELIISCLAKRLNIRLKIIRKKLDDIYEIINLANEL